MKSQFFHQYSINTIELTIGTWPSKELQPEDYKKYEQYKIDFEKKYENTIILPDEWKFDLQTFWTKATSNQLPDLYTTYFTEMRRVSQNGYAADLTEVLKGKDYFEYVNPAILNVVSVNGKIYGIPTDIYEFGLIVNTEMFEEAGLLNEDGTPMQPKDWYELAEFAKRIKDVTGKTGLVLNTSNKTGGWIFTNIAWSFGVDFMEEQEDGTWKATFDCEEMVDAVEWVKSLKWEYNVLSDNILIDNDERNRLFGTEEAAIIIGSSGVLNSLQKYGFKYEKAGMTAIPAGPQRHVALVGGNVYIMSEKCTQEEINRALDWIDYIGKGYDFNKEETSIVLSCNGVKLYKEALEDPSIELQAEEPICAQELYGILDKILQIVLTNKDADIKDLVRQANLDFQKNYLDNIEVK